MKYSGSAADHLNGEWAIQFDRCNTFRGAAVESVAFCSAVQCGQCAVCSVQVPSVQCAQSAQCAGRSYYRRGCGVRGSSHQPPQPTPRSKESRAFLFLHHFEFFSFHWNQHQCHSGSLLQYQCNIKDQVWWHAISYNLAICHGNLMKRTFVLWTSFPPARSGQVFWVLGDIKIWFCAIPVLPCHCSPI